MKKNLLLIIIAFVCICKVTIAQKDTLTAAQTKDLLSQIKKDNKSSLRSYGYKACKCIDSIDITNKTQAEVAKEIGNCIDKQTEPYQLITQMMETLTGTSNNIVINTDKNSNGYKKYYFEIERWLNDSCSAVRNKIAADNKESDMSFTKNPEAMEEYNKGVKLVEAEKYAKAIENFNKAVAIDPKFAFAWDNLGICYRRTDDYDNAIVAYKKSLELDPKGKTPLHNLPIAYEYKKEYDKALTLYQQIADIYPDDPEAYYGAGRIYLFYKEDLEKALDNMCKAYNAYTTLKSPYRVDAEDNISIIYKKLKEAGKEDIFNKILADNKISTK